MEKCPICKLLMSHVNRRSVCTPIQQQVERQTEAPVPRCYPRLEKKLHFNHQPTDTLKKKRCRFDITSAAGQMVILFQVDFFC